MAIIAQRRPVLQANIPASAAPDAFVHLHRVPAHDISAVRAGVPVTFPDLAPNASDCFMSQHECAAERLTSQNCLLAILVDALRQSVLSDTAPHHSRHHKSQG